MPQVNRSIEEVKSLEYEYRLKLDSGEDGLNSIQSEIMTQLKFLGHYDYDINKALAS